MPTLSLCMITKNEEKNLPSCLESVKDFVDEIIVVDTGSKDQTKKIAQKYGAKIFDFTWCDDFSLARNESLKHATKDWILVLDADEVVARKDLENLKKLLETTTYDGFLVDQRNYTEDHTLVGWQPCDSYTECKASGFQISPIVRVFRNKPVYRFKNRVHEEIDTAIITNKGKIVHSHLPVHHYGHMGDLETKREKYLQLGLQQIKDHPEEVRARYEVSRVYKTREQYPLAIEQLEIVVKEKPAYKLAMNNLADCYAKVGKTQEALDCYKKAIQLDPRNENAYLNFGVMLLGLERVKEAVELFKLALRVNPKSPAAYQNLIGALVKTRQLSEAFSVCLVAYERTKMKKFKETLHAFRKKLGVEAEIYEHLHNERYAEAEKLLHKLVKEQPHWHGHYLNLHTLYLKMGKKEEAQTMLVKGLEVIKDSKGRALLQKSLEKI